MRLSKQERRQKAPTVPEDTVSEPKDVRNATLAEDVDDILDEIDDVLEENAEQFVNSFVQLGGQ